MLAGPLENVIIKDIGSVIVIGNNNKWALGYGWREGRRGRQGFLKGICRLLRLLKDYIN